MAQEQALVRELRPRADELCLGRGWSVRRGLGAGATAAVYEIEVASEIQALKIYSPRFLKGRQGVVTRARFQLVLERLLDHSCDQLVKIFEGNEVGDTLFLRMERVPGSSLGEVLHLVPVERIQSILIQIAKAAKYL
jgi:serine/threonine protein kinase